LAGPEWELFSEAKTLSDGKKYTESIEVLDELIALTTASGDHYWGFYARRDWAKSQYYLGKLADQRQGLESALAELDEIQPGGSMPVEDRLFEQAILGGMLATNAFEQGQIGLAAVKLGQAKAAIRRLYQHFGVSNYDFESGIPPNVPPIYRYLVPYLLDREAAHHGMQGRTEEAIRLRRIAIQPRPEAELSEREIIYRRMAKLHLAINLSFFGWRTEAIAVTQELAEQPSSAPGASTKRLATLNLARFKSRWHGPSEEFLADAKAAASQLIKANQDGASRVIANMEFDLNPEKFPLNDLERLEMDAMEHGRTQAADFSRRDRLILQSELGDLDGLEQDMHDMLQTYRRRGYLRGEPTAYREYADVLSALGRYEESLVLHQKAIDLTRGFGWWMHIPPLLIKKANLLESIGRMEESYTVWAEIDAYLLAHPDLPPERVVRVFGGRARFLERQGKQAEADAFRKQGRDLAQLRDLPEYQQRWLKPEEASPEKPAVPQADEKPANRSDLQPFEVWTKVETGESGRGRFILSNPTPNEVSGTLLATGVITESSWDQDQGIVSLKLASAEEKPIKWEQKIDLEPGDQILIYSDLDRVDVSEDTDRLTLRWQEDGLNAPDPQKSA